MRYPTPSPSRLRSLHSTALPPKRKYSARPFFICIFILCLLVTVSFLGKGADHHGEAANGANLARRHLEALDAIERMPGLLVKRDQEVILPKSPAVFQWLAPGNVANRFNPQCRFVHGAKDKCAFIKANCPDEETGLISYLQLYYCKLHQLKPIVFAMLITWLGLLFSTIGIAASDFFCVNLSTIANILGMSESMAGVTFLAFGNGSPDVFSTFAAMKTHSGSLAVGELIGAAGFITAVVAGSMALVRPFNVARKSFVRDVCFFIVAASFSMVFLADGSLHLWECAVMVAFYIFYVVFVVLWHWYLARRWQRRTREAAARGHFVAAVDVELVDEEEIAYDEDAAAGERRSLLRGNSAEDFGALERGGSPYLTPGDDEDVDEEGRDHWLSEINKNMRVHRRQAGSRQNTITPIRPSLVGALEFRAVLSSLQKSRNMQTIPINLRRYSDDPTYTTAQQQGQLLGVADSDVSPSFGDNVDEGGSTGLLRPSVDLDRSTAPLRTRAVSAGDALGLRLDPRTANLHPPTATFGRLGRTGGPGGGLQPPRQGTATSSSAPSRPPNFLISPPNSEPASRGVSPASANVGRSPLDRVPLSKDDSNDFVNHYQPIVGSPGEIAENPRQSPNNISQRVPRIVIPRQGSSRRSNPVSPFPTYQDSYDSATSTPRVPSLRLPVASIFSDSSYDQRGFDDFEGKPPWWWPYKILPPPRVLVATLFPTIYSWHDKTLWEKLLGLAAAPSVFLLAITLPVVEADADDDDSDVGIPESGSKKPTENGQQGLGGGSTASSQHSPLLHVGITERGYFDPHPQNTNHHSHPSLGPIPVKGYGGHGNSATVATSTERHHHHEQYSHAKPSSSPVVHPSNQPQVPTTSTSPILPPSPAVSPKEWNRWLVSTQIFTAPFFLVFIIWLNTSDPLNGHDLLKPSLYALLASLLLFGALLLTTSATTPPRHRYLLCFLGFTVSVAWISTIASEVVGVLKAVGVILDISDAILGLTVFAVGNSLGDLVADITVANLGHPVMALSACFGGPLLNILLGIGLSGLYMTVTDGEHRHERHPGRPMKYKPYQIEVSTTLIVSGATLLVTLVGLLVVVPWNGWRMDRRIGWGLIALWGVSTVGNLVVEVKGFGGDLA